MAEFTLPPPQQQLFKVPNPSPLRLKTEQSLASLRPAPFTMKAERFHYKYLKNPGPGTYECSTRDKHSSDFHIPKQTSSPIPKQHQWITSKGREPFQVKQSSPSDYLGLKQEIGKGSRSDWSKDQRFNYEKWEKKVRVVPGVGVYHPEVRERSHTQPIKERASPKTYLDTILRERKERMRMAQLEEELFSERIEEVNLVKESPTVQKVGPSPAFKSKSIRFSSRELSTPNIGPGSYNIANPEKKATKKTLLKLPKPCKSPSTPELQSPLKQDKASPGPGAYEIANLHLQSNRKAVLGLILKQQRFGSTVKTTVPGPGQYMQQRFIHLNLDQLHRNGKAEHPTFGTTERFSPSPPPSSPFGNYDLSHHDISQRLLKQREYYERVKQFKFTIPVPPKRH